MKTIIIGIIIAIMSSLSMADVLKINSKGVEYCPGKQPIKFNSKTDIDMWVDFEGPSFATLYADAELTMPVAGMYMVTTPISSRLTAFNGFSGSGNAYIAITGTLSLDSDGNIKGAKGTAIRKGMVNKCYIHAKVIGVKIR